VSFNVMSTIATSGVSCLMAASAPLASSASAAT